MKILRYFLFTLLFALLFYGTERFCHKRTDGFAVTRLRTITEPPPFIVTNDPEAKSLLLSILQSPLSYCGKGGQCYAFSSLDDKYVVKILRYNGNYPPFWLKRMPSFPTGRYKAKKLADKQRKLQKEYTSYRIALEELKEETGILYFHLEPDALGGAVLQIRDKIGIVHRLPAEKYQFYVQKKGSPFYPNIRNLLASGKRDKVRTALDQFVSYLVLRASKQITDCDDGVWRNFTFCEDKPLQIDIGQFIKNPSLASKESYKKDILFFAKDFLRWLQTIDPFLADYFLTRLDTETEKAHAS